VTKNSSIVITKPFQRRSIDEWGDLSVEIRPPPLPRLKRPQPPARMFNPRSQEI
jgi:hypothetical protein